jgi:hypothetical protein
MERYGVENPFQSEDIKDKIKKTNMERYGDECISKTTHYKTAFKKTNMERYGVENPFQSEDIKDKIKKTNMERYGEVYPTQSDVIKNKAKQTREVTRKTRNIMRDTTYLTDLQIDLLNDKEFLKDQHKTKSLTQIAYDIKVTPTTVSHYFYDHDLEITTHNTSIGETQLKDYIVSLGLHIEENDRSIIKPKELDIVIPELKIAIEYCGLYWHSEKRKERNYHKNKLEDVNEKGYTLLTVFEDEWLESPEIVKSKIKHLVGLNDSDKVYARKTTIKNVDIKDRIEFFKNNHIQGDGGGSIVYGLYNKDILVACIVIKDMGRGIYYINRYATSANVVGGFSKLLSHFKKNNEWNEIYTFADRRWSVGNLYITNGFDHVYNTAPNHFYTRDGLKRESRKRYMKHKLSKILDNYDEKLSGKDNMSVNGYYVIYDCGNMKFVMTKENI